MHRDIQLYIFSQIGSIRLGPSPVQSTNQRPGDRELVGGKSITLPQAKSKYHAASTNLE